MISAPLPKSAELPIGACANAMELIVVNAVARAIVLRLMLVSFFSGRDGSVSCKFAKLDAADESDSSQDKAAPLSVNFT